jgi:hypothetical protein
MLVTDCHCCVIDETWKDIARMAWAGYLNDGRGLVRIDARGADSRSMLYVPLTVGLNAQESQLAQIYDPTKEAVVVIVDEEGRHACRASHLDWTPPSIYARVEKAPELN